jgi:hypothetical protein
MLHEDEFSNKDEHSQMRWCGLQCADDSDRVHFSGSER